MIMLFFSAICAFKENLIDRDKSSSTVNGYETEMVRFLNYLEKNHNRPFFLKEVGLKEMEDYLAYLTRTNHAPATRRRITNIFRAFYKFCERSGYLSNNPAVMLESVKSQLKEREYINDVEFNQLISAMEHPLVEAVLSTLYYTGLRIGECLSLDTEDIHPKLEYIMVKNGKGKKQRKIPINNTLQKILSEYIEEFTPSQNQKFFTTKQSGALSITHVNMVLRNCRKSIGWKKKISCHNLRHSFASNLVKKNVNLVLIQKLLGHSSLAVTSVYTHSNLDDLKEAVDSL